MAGAGFDYLIVGAGFAGSVLAERLAAGLDKRVLVIDRRPHIGGNAYDHYNDDGILIHRYGPHIFHTNAQRIVASGLEGGAHHRKRGVVHPCSDFRKLSRRTSIPDS